MASVPMCDTALRLLAPSPLVCGPPRWCPGLCASSKCVGTRAAQLGDFCGAPGSLLGPKKAEATHTPPMDQLECPCGHAAPAAVASSWAPVQERGRHPMLAGTGERAATAAWGPGQGLLGGRWPGQPPFCTGTLAFLSFHGRRRGREVTQDRKREVTWTRPAPGRRGGP